MTAVDAKRAVGVELEGDLTNARHLSVMVQWIGLARDYIEGVQWVAENLRPGLKHDLKVAGVWINDLEWGECEGNALRHLHQRIESSIRDIETKVGLGGGGAQ